MSIICEVGVWRSRGHARDFDGFGVGRALILATYAYESRMRRPPPEIELKSLGVSVPHILALRYHTMDGKTHIMDGDQIIRMLAMMAAFGRDRGDRPPRSQRSV